MMVRRFRSLAASLATRSSNSALVAQTQRGPAAQLLARWQPPPRDYDPQFGDYPNLPWQEIAKRSPYQHWDDPVHRRNFGETIHEEFDVQDGWFQGDHEPLEDFKKGLIGQLSIAAIMAAFAAWTWLVFDPNSKPSKKQLPPEVQNYLETQGNDRIIHRPYEPLCAPTVDTFAHPDPQHS